MYILSNMLCMWKLEDLNTTCLHFFSEKTKLPCHVVGQRIMFHSGSTHSVFIHHSTEKDTVEVVHIHYKTIFPQKQKQFITRHHATSPNKTQLIKWTWWKRKCFKINRARTNPVFKYFVISSIFYVHTQCIIHIPCYGLHFCYHLFSYFVRNSHLHKTR